MAWFVYKSIKKTQHIGSEWRVTSHNVIEHVHAFPIKSWESKASYNIDTKERQVEGATQQMRTQASIIY